MGQMKKIVEVSIITLVKVFFIMNWIGISEYER